MPRFLGGGHPKDPTRALFSKRRGLKVIKYDDSGLSFLSYDDHHITIATPYIIESRGCSDEIIGPPAHLYNMQCMIQCIIKCIIKCITYSL